MELVDESCANYILIFTSVFSSIIAFSTSVFFFNFFRTRFYFSSSLTFNFYYRIGGSHDRCAESAFVCFECYEFESRFSMSCGRRDRSNNRAQFGIHGGDRQRNNDVVDINQQTSKTVIHWINHVFAATLVILQLKITILIMAASKIHMFAVKMFIRYV